MEIRPYTEKDFPAMVRIWNKAVQDSDAFPQEGQLDDQTGAALFAAQTYCGVADGCGNVIGLYILHPNSIGRCGRHIGEKLVLDCLAQAKRHGFGILPFNAVVENNLHARRLYERLGFVQAGTVPNGFTHEGWILSEHLPV